MLQIIKQATKNFFNPFGKLEGWNDNEEDFTMIDGKVDEAAFLTAAELQYLRGILADKIKETEQSRRWYLEDAKGFKNVTHSWGEQVSKKYFKKHRKVKSDLKKLVKIQQKVKHSLITMG